MPVWDNRDSAEGCVLTEFQEVCKVFIKAHMICLVLWLLETMEGKPWEAHFPEFLFHCALEQEKASAHLENTYHNKNTDNLYEVVVEWSPTAGMKRVQKEIWSLWVQIKTIFPQVWTKQVNLGLGDRFCGFTQVSHQRLFIIWVGEGVQKMENGICQGARKPSRCLQFLLAPTIIYNHCLPHFTLSDSSTLLPCFRDIRILGWQKSSNKGTCLQQQNGLQPHVPRLINISKAYYYLFDSALHGMCISNKPVGLTDPLEYALSKKGL